MNLETVPTNWIMSKLARFFLFAARGNPVTRCSRALGTVQFRCIPKVVPRYGTGASAVNRYRCGASCVCSAVFPADVIPEPVEFSCQSSQRPGKRKVPALNSTPAQHPFGIGSGIGFGIGSRIGSGIGSRIGIGFEIDSEIGFRNGIGFETKIAFGTESVSASP